MSEWFDQYEQYDAFHSNGVLGSTHLQIALMNDCHHLVVKLSYYRSDVQRCTVTPNTTGAFFMRKKQNGDTGHIKYNSIHPVNEDS